MKFLMDNLGGDKVAFARDRFTERAQNSQRVSMRSPIGTPLAEKGEFGLVSGLRAVSASLLCKRGAGRDVEGSEGVAKCRGENIRRSEVSARDEPGASISAVQSQD